MGDSAGHKPPGNETRRGHAPPIDALAAEANLLASLSGAEFLRKVYAAAKASRTRYSYRHFAEELGFGATNYLHLICKGERPLSVAAAERIAEALAMHDRERRYFVLLARYECARSTVEREVVFEEIVELKGRALATKGSKDSFEYFSEWYHAAIREMVLLPGFEPHPEWIAARLVPRVTPDQARRSWDLLVRLGLVHQTPQGGWRQTDVRISTPDGARHVAIIRYHQKMAELGKECVTRVKAVRRDVSALTIPMSPALFDRLRAEASEWKERILARSEGLAEAEDIYQVNIQLFPLTETPKK